MIKESDRMVKVAVIEGFSLEKFDELQNIVRNDPNRNEYGKLYVNDVFECTEDMAKYLMGDNKINKVVVKIIEVIPEEEVEKELTYLGDEHTAPQYMEKPKSTKKKKTSKK